MKKSRKRLVKKENQPSNEKGESKRPFLDDVVLIQRESEAIPVTPDRILDMVEASEEDTWQAIEERLESVDSETVRRNVAKVDARQWLQASKALATEVKAVAERATSKKEIFRIDAAVDAFDRQLKERKINIQPCRLHCQNAIRDAYARLS